MTDLILASSSRVRAALLGAAGVKFEMVAPDVDEDAVKRHSIERGGSPLQIAADLADRKAIAVSRQRDGLVIGADQTLALQGRMYDKPASLEAARRTLESLRGQAHELHSCVALAMAGDVLWRTQATARLNVRRFSDAFLDAYLARHGQALLSAVGAYELEGEGVQLFESVEGDYFSILGLPLLPLLAELRRRGLVAQ